MTEKEEKKEKKLHKYLNSSYAELVGSICSDLAKTYCYGCKKPFSPGLFHSCLLPDNEKIDKYGEVSLKIACKSGLVYKTFRDKVYVFMESDIEKIIKYDLENPKKYKDVRTIIRDLYE